MTTSRVQLQGGRRVSDHIAVTLLGLSVVFIVAILAVIVGNIVVNGFSSVSWEFVSQPPREGLTAGGILPAIVGTAALVLLMTIAAVPLGVAPPSTCMSTRRQRGCAWPGAATRLRKAVPGGVSFSSASFQRFWQP